MVLSGYFLFGYILKNIILENDPPPTLLFAPEETLLNILNETVYQTT